MIRTINSNLIADEKNFNGRIYSSDEITAALAKLKWRIERLGPIPGVLGYPESVTDLDKISHLVHEAALVDSQVQASVQFLDTPSGILMRTLFEAMPKRIIMGSRGYGNVQPDGHVTDFQIITFDAILDEDE